MTAQNLEMLANAARELDDLLEKVFFVGGTTILCYITDPAMSEIRPTVDVDCVVNVNSLSQYRKFINDLRKKGFHEDTAPKAPLCRYVKGELTLDIMPTDPNVLGFSNRWYQEGIRNAMFVTVENMKVQIFKIGFALATKFEAFKSRGKYDLYTSHDFEDIVTIFDGNQRIAYELENAHGSTALKEYLTKELSVLIKQENLVSSIEAHINDRNQAAERAKIVKKRMLAVIENLTKQQFK